MAQLVIIVSVGARAGAHAGMWLAWCIFLSSSYPRASVLGRMQLAQCFVVVVVVCGHPCWGSGWHGTAPCRHHHHHRVGLRLGMRLAWHSSSSLCLWAPVLGHMWGCGQHGASSRRHRVHEGHPGADAARAVPRRGCGCLRASVLGMQLVRHSSSSSSSCLRVPMLRCMRLAAPRCGHGHVRLRESVLGFRAHVGRWPARCLVIVVIIVFVCG